MQNKFAKFISSTGHPFITIPVFVLIIMFSYNEFKSAALISLLIIGGIFIPITFWNFINTKKGIYTNFDVSDKSQRNSMYFFIIFLLILVTIILFITDQPEIIKLNLLFALVLLVISFAVNKFIKASLHISFTCYLAFLVIPINLLAGIIILFSTILIAWSRIKLGRHTLKEIAAGMIIGIVTGISMLFAEGFI